VIFENPKRFTNGPTTQNVRQMYGRAGQTAVQTPVFRVNVLQNVRLCRTNCSTFTHKNVVHVLSAAPPLFSMEIPEKHPLQPPVDKLQGAGGGDVKADFVSLRPAKPEANPGGGLP